MNFIIIFTKHVYPSCLFDKYYLNEDKIDV